MEKTARKIDRRIQRTRALLHEALMELIHEKGYHHVTVQDITDRANVARTTFYLHYKDVDDLLFSGMAEIYEDLFRKFETQAGDGLAKVQGSTADLEHVAQHAAFYRIMMSENGSMKFLLRVQDFLAMMFQKYLLNELPPAQTRIPVPLLAHLLAGAEIGVIRWWLFQDNMQTPPAEVGRLGDAFCVPGLLWALGLSPDAPPAPDDAPAPCEAQAGVMRSSPPR
ncbi:MAG: TetR/AcrR family transcriptional regulator [Anaerolineae bacterium]|nr:TetR/AcrR family transcriptional regulator [Anaerolineae bacterium]